MSTALTAKLDPELPVVQAILEGDRDAFEEFVHRQGPWVRGVIYGVLGNADRVEDVEQQVWSAVWQQLKTLQDPRSWRFWLYRLARNATVDAGRELTRRRRLHKLTREQAAENINRETPPVQLGKSEQRELVHDAIRALPVLYREPFVLRHFEGWSYRQIAEVFKVPVDTVETRLVRARRHLREHLQDKI